MIRFIFDLMGACAHFLWDAFQALASFGFRLLSALVAVITWPLDVCWDLLGRVFHWAPSVIGFCVLLALVLLGAKMLSHFCRVRRYK